MPRGLVLWAPCCPGCGRPAEDRLAPGDELGPRAPVEGEACCMRCHAIVPICATTRWRRHDGGPLTP